jgi:hypothetical protein
MKYRKEPRAAWPYFVLADFGHATKTFGWTDADFEAPSTTGTLGWIPPVRRRTHREGSSLGLIEYRNNGKPQRKSKTLYSRVL